MSGWLMVLGGSWAIAYTYIYMTQNQVHGQLNLLPAYVSREFTGLNEQIFQLGRQYSKPLKIWFSIGSVVAAVTMLCGTFYLMWNITLAMARLVMSSDTEVPLSTSSVMIPGVTMPWNSLGYLWITIFLSAAIHEFGHALAAALCEIRMISVGVFFAVIFPGAYVRFDSYYNISTLDQIKIQSAGIWHNAVLVIFCLGQLTVLPTVLSPWYNMNHGVTVIGLPEYSVFEGTIAVGDVIISIDHQPTLHLAQWKEEILNITSLLIENEPSLKGSGYCVPSSQVTYVVDLSCCRNDTESEMECFSFLSIGDFSWSQTCLDGKQTGEASLALCSLESGCDDENHVCLVPHQQDSSTLLRLELQDQRVVMIQGYPPDMHAELELSDYSLIHSSDGSYAYFWTALPSTIERFWGFLYNLSGSIGFFNALPMHYLDGSHLCASYLQLIVKDESKRVRILQAILTFGDVLFVMMTLVSVVNVFI